jgi:predicted amidophosphoribosyltransferase
MGGDDFPSRVRGKEFHDSHRTKTQTLLSAARFAMRPAEWVFGALLDFLIEDACVLCGELRDPRPRQTAGDAPGGRPHPRGLEECLLAPVTTPLLFGTIKITNHPVCARCAVGFDSSRKRGLLGWVFGGAVVETTQGGRFEFLGGGGAAVTGLGGRVDPTGRGVQPMPIPVISPFMTNDNILKIIHLMKFGRYRALADPVGRAMAWAARAFAPLPDGDAIVVPTPMEHRDLRRRGFNQAQEIANAVADDLAVPVRSGVLRKTVRTAPQSKTAHGDRAGNVRGAFDCSRAGTQGRHVVLVDDLVTTGATAGACCAAIIAAGARSVTVLCFGRAV